MADIFQEVEDDLKQENFRKMWKRCRGYFVAISAVLVILTGAWQGWKAYDLQRREERSLAFYEATLLAEGDQTDEALQALQALTEDLDGYGVLAAFQEANLLQSQGENQAATARLDRLAAEDLPIAALSQLASLMAARLELERGALDAADQRLETLLATDSVFYYHALQLQALVAFERGDKDRTRQLFEDLGQDSEVPQKIVTESQQILSLLEAL